MFDSLTWKLEEEKKQTQHKQFENFLKRKVLKNWCIDKERRRFLAFNLRTIVILCKFEYGKHVRFCFFHPIILIIAPKKFAFRRF